MKQSKLFKSVNVLILAPMVTLFTLTAQAQNESAQSSAGKSHESMGHMHEKMNACMTSGKSHDECMKEHGKMDKKKSKAGKKPKAGASDSGGHEGHSH